jgi:uncharacterized protein (TIGR02145 family)
MKNYLYSSGKFLITILLLNLISYSCEKPDDQLKKFPKTEEELRESIELSKKITQEGNLIIETAISAAINQGQKVDVNEITANLKKIKGVYDATPTESGIGIVVDLIDSTCLNLLVVASDDERLFEIDYGGKSLQPLNMLIKKSESSKSTPSGNGKALILAPFQEKFKTDLGKITAFLKAAGYKSYQKIDQFADLNSFRGDTLIKYDIVLIITHGMADGKTNNRVKSTLLATGQKLDDVIFLRDLSTEEQNAVARLGLKKDEHFAISVPWINVTTKSDFPNSWIYADACESAKIDNGPSSFSEVFLNKGAGGYNGWDSGVSYPFANIVMETMTEKFSSGLSFTTATDAVRKDPLLLAITWSPLIIPPLVIAADINIYSFDDNQTSSEPFYLIKSSGKITDIDGNNYKTVKIGAQTWMAENLKTTRLNDGTSISLVTDQTAWYALTTPGYCFYNNNSSNKEVYGALYNWFATSSGKLCPTGWHVPSNDEWKTLENTIGGVAVAGKKLKESGTSHWPSPNNGTDEFGFAALPGGYRHGTLGFSAINEAGVWSTSSLVTTGGKTVPWYVVIYDHADYTEHGSTSVTWGTKDGYSIRCVKNEAGVAPIAGFSATPTTITAGQSVQFTDQSTNNPTSWSWSFGDGAASTLRNPSHIYNTSGTYSVTLRASNSYGYDDEVKSNFITVNSVSNEVIFNPNLTYGTVQDIDGNTYKTIQIGTQTWTAENLKTTKLNDGTVIPLITDVSVWKNLNTMGFCYYNNLTSNGDLYGALYNWHVTKTGKLCSSGWHVPSNDEWKSLESFLGGATIAGKKLKEIGTTHWNSPNSGTNESGFTALPGGFISVYYLNGFSSLRNGGVWATSTLHTDSYPWNVSMYYNSDQVLHNTTSTVDGKKDGYSVRCVKD